MMRAHPGYALLMVLAAAAGCSSAANDDGSKTGNEPGDTQPSSETRARGGSDNPSPLTSAPNGSGGTSAVGSGKTAPLGTSTEAVGGAKGSFGGSRSASSASSAGTALGGRSGAANTNADTHLGPSAGGTLIQGSASLTSTRTVGGQTNGNATQATAGTRGDNTSEPGAAPLVPESGALLGLYYGDESLADTEAKLGSTVPLHLTYYAWEDDWTRGITAEDLRAGRIPFVNWELFGAVLDDIIAGKDDAMIRQRALSAKNLSGKLFLDFGAEMNGDWSPWSGAQNGKSADKYIAAYRHVHDLFVANAATNVIWAFCPNVTSEPDADWNEPLDYYPGDDYVDWMCVDGYNWGTSDTWGIWQSFHEVFKDIYPILASKQKPIVIGEMASTELGGNKADWIRQIIPTLENDFPLIKGLIWFDIDKETDWRISSSSASEAAFKAMANDAYFKH